MTFAVHALFEPLKLFEWTTPLRIRRENVFVAGSEQIFFDLERGQIRVLDGQRFGSTLATSTFAYKSGGQKGFVGKAFVDEAQIEVTQKDDGPYILYLRTEKVVEIRYPPSSQIRFDCQGIILFADTSRYYWNPSESNKVLITCDESNEKLATVFGIIVCSLLFDHLLDSGSHI